MDNTRSQSVKYLLAASLGAIGGGIIVALAPSGLPINVPDDVQHEEEYENPIGSGWL
jgi:hypothetical protein